MNRPRCVVPNTTYMLTRRTIGGQYLFRPDGEIPDIFAYCLALCARRHGVRVHAACVLSNHWHLVFTDVEAVVGRFLQDLHSLIARCVNRARDRRESLWAVRQPSLVELVDRDAVWEKLVYTLGNPVSSRLVASSRAWPGFQTRPSDICESGRVVARPMAYFSENGAEPDTVTLNLTLPPALEHLSHAEYAKRLTDRLEAHESNLRDAMRQTDSPYLGCEGVLAQDPFASPRRQPESPINPAIACRDKATRVAKLSFLADFRRLYAEALARWRRGLRDTVFPYGTYQLARLHNVTIAAAPT
ncbi:MAG: hypothetical protein H6744_19745 [Deltaproteobacteria bacterium]|nr:hypothetical protein [Deltaproteobacteria bacterium]MCB9788916.1 hypothetical protein [Deltaproteobacteria bacterium]